ncbi:Glyoxylase, beta-lactamase superfamily II [Alteromonadaceae bacterium Bs31]|nr:Glyoxylase, beta-lactamase superfamily II [Alteromonadaceae bacterium Bs31]
MLQFDVLPVTPFQQNCSLVWCDKSLEGALIDPGGEVERLLGLVEKHNVTLSKVLLTHGHLDHVGGTAELKKRLQLPVIGPHKDDAFWIDGLEGQAHMMNFSTPEHFQPDQWLVDGDRVSVGDVSLQVIHCPGHTPGHVVLFDDQSQTAFVGDVIFQGSIGRTDFPRGNHQQLISSIRDKLFPLGDDVRFVPGHGPFSTFGQERVSNPFVSDKLFG